MILCSGHVHLLCFLVLFTNQASLPVCKSKFNSEKQFVKSDFEFCSEGSLLIKEKYSKTIQFKDRHYKIKLFPTNHVLCPIRAVRLAFDRCKLEPSTPAFVCDNIGTPLCSNVFNGKVKQLVAKCGKDPSVYSSHSFRRGNATWAFQCGIPGEIIQEMGDWKSLCYKDYLDQVPVSVHDSYRLRFTMFLP